MARLFGRQVAGHTSKS